MKRGYSPVKLRLFVLRKDDILLFDEYLDSLELLKKLRAYEVID